MKKFAFTFGLTLVLGVLLNSNSATAVIIPLIDGNSSLEVDPDPGGLGAVNWTVDGVDQLERQWFWYRVGSRAGEAPINSLNLVGTNIFSTNFEPNDNGLFMLYEDPVNNFTIDVLYVLAGGSAGSGVSDIAEQIRIVNTSETESLPFHFFQYSNFDLNDTPLNDTVEANNANSVSQFDPNLIVSETVVAPRPTHSQVALFPTIVDSLNDGAPTTLNDFGGPISGDVTWAYQWDFVLAPGQSYIISKDKHIQMVPEPSAMAILGTGLLGLYGFVRGARKGSRQRTRPQFSQRE